MLMSVIIFFIASTLSIGWSVNYKCQAAQEKYSGDCVDALSSLVESDSESFEDRNRAIWALGQLGDSRALPVLEKYYTGVEKDNESLDQDISQYELQKAIDLCEGGFNAGKWVWGWMIEEN